MFLMALHVFLVVCFGMVQFFAGCLSAATGMYDCMVGLSL